MFPQANTLFYMENGNPYQQAYFSTVVSGLLTFDGGRTTANHWRHEFGTPRWVGSVVMDHVGHACGLPVACQVVAHIHPGTPSTPSMKGLHGLVKQSCHPGMPTGCHAGELLGWVESLIVCMLSQGRRPWHKGRATRSHMQVYMPFPPFQACWPATAHRQWHALQHAQVTEVPSWLMPSGGQQEANWWNGLSMHMGPLLAQCTPALSLAQFTGLHHGQSGHPPLPAGLVDLSLDSMGGCILATSLKMWMAGQDTFKLVLHMKNGRKRRTDDPNYAYIKVGA